MDARDMDEVSRNIHYFLARLSSQNRALHSFPDDTAPLLPESLRDSQVFGHRTTSRRRLKEAARAPPRTPSPRITILDMGIRGTDDYLTARAANPRTGLISPSVVTNLTPRTPVSPGEALSLYGEAPAYSPTSNIASTAKSSPTSRTRPAGPRGRWRQNSKGWVMETVDGVASPKIITANSAIPRLDFDASEDRFVIPMPTARDPQPYPQENEANAAECYNKAQRLSQQDIKIGINGRPLSIGAGPRKFVEATKALKSCNVSLDSIPSENLDSMSLAQVAITSEVRLPNSHLAKPSYSPFIAYSPSSERTFSNGSLDSIDFRMKNMPGGFGSPRALANFNTPDSDPIRISRKPVGSPVLTIERRDSVIDAESSDSANEKEVCIDHQTPSIPSNRVRSNSNTNRFQDLRQLPRVRIIHPDGTLASPEKRASILLESASTPPPPYNRHSLVSTASSESNISVTDSLSPLETQVMGLLAWTITQLFCKPTETCDQPPTNPILGVIQAIHTISDVETKPMERLQAIKTLFLTALRAVMILGCILAVVRIGTAVGKVLEIVFWPVSVVLVVLKWILGLR